MRGCALAWSDGIAFLVEGDAVEGRRAGRGLCMGPPWGNAHRLVHIVWGRW